MSITADYHIHSHFSGDSETPMETMVQKGISLGLTHMCFTEHMDLNYPVSENIPEGTLELNTDSYLFDIIRYKEKYASQIQVSFGVELGLQPQLTLEHAKYVKAYDFDFVLASSHLCNGKNPYYPDFFVGRSEQDAYTEYFESILENIKKFSNFDVYGHLDYVVRYGPNKDTNYRYSSYSDIFDSILQLLIDNGKGIELNMGGLHNGLKEPNPCSDIVKRYHELGGEIITVGSDAHMPERLASGFDLAAQILSSCGFRYYTTFKGRMTDFHKI